MKQSKSKAPASTKTGKPAKSRPSDSSGKKVSAPLSSGTRQNLLTPITTSITLSTRGVRTVRTDTGEQYIALPFSPIDSVITGNSAPIIGMYETFEVLSLQVCYEPTCAATQPGIIALRYDPDPNDQLPESFAEFIQTGYVAYGPQWESLSFPVPKDAIMNLKSYFVDPLADSQAHAMSRMSVPGQIQIYLSADVAATSIGVLTVKAKIKAKTLTEQAPTATLEFEDTSPNQSFGSWLSLGAKVAVDGARGVFQNSSYTDAPGSVRHFEARTPGTYRVTVVGTGTGLGTINAGPMTGETVSGVTWTIESAINNAGNTISTIVYTIVVAANFYTLLSGNKSYWLDILPAYWSAASTISNVKGTITWNP